MIEFKRLIHGLSLVLLVSIALSVAPALAQDVPNVITPLQVEPDPNGVNLATGKIVLDLPTLEIPGAPRLTFERIQDVAPYISGVLDTAPGLETMLAFGGFTQSEVYSNGEPVLPDGSRTERHSAHLGGDQSVSFSCTDYDCESLSGDGSSLRIGSNGRVIQLAGSGAKYIFSLKHVKSESPEVSLYYASRVDYSDGETITYTYETAALPGDTFNRTFYRPTRVDSNRGFFLTLTYQPGALGDAGWNKVAEAALFNLSTPTTPLALLTYAADGTTITDLGSRSYQCQGCTNGLGSKKETWAGQLSLPSETAPAIAVLVNSSASLPSESLLGTVNRDGRIWTYAYTNPVLDASINEYRYSGVTVSGPDGYSKSYAMATFEKRNRLSSTTDELGRTHTFSYDGFRVTGITAPEGNRVEVAYDDYGNIVQKTTFSKSGNATLVETAEPISFTSGCIKVMCWRQAWLRDAKGNQTDFVYNNRGQVIERIDPADASGIRRKTIIEYDANSRKIVERVCGLGTTCGTAQEYRTETDYWGATTLPSAVRKIDAVQGLTLQTTFTYDLAGRLLTTDSPLPGTDDTAHFRYDIHGRKMWEIGPLGANGTRPAKRFTYRDSDDQVTAVESGYVTLPTDTSLSVVSRSDVSYDSRRNAVRTAMSAGGAVWQVEDMSYNDRGLLVCKTVRMNAAVFGALPPDACTASTAGSQGGDRITRTIYDNAGQIVQIRKAVGTLLEQAYATYSYTANGKQEFVIDANGNRAKFEYDGFDRLVKWLFPSTTRPAAFNPATQATALTSAGAVSAGDYEQYGYDSNGNRTTHRKRDGTTLTFAYDNLGRVTVKTVPERAGLAATHSRDVYYSYNQANLQTAARFDSANGAEGLTTGYNLFGQIATSTIMMDSITRTLTSVYDVHGNRTRLTHTDGQFVTYQYDAADRLTAILRSGTATVASYTYDAPGRRTGFNGGISTSYGYDTAGRLNSLTNNMSASAHNNQWSFTFNPAGQLVSNTRTNDLFAWTGAVNVERTYTANGLNQYTAAGPAAFCYDANGNLTADGSSVYRYDIENRLVEKRAQGTGNTNCAALAYSGVLQAGLRYDPSGRLYEVTGTSGTSRMLYDGDALTAEYNTTGTVLRRYVHGADAKSDDPIAWYEGATFTATNERKLRPDWQGSLVVVTNSTGSSVLAVNRYDEYGIPQSTNAGRFQYTGQAWIAELGMYYYKARIYSPTIGRFLQTDPIGYEDQVNLYAYVGNDPVKGTDFSGMQQDDDERLEVTIEHPIGDGATTANVGKDGASLSYNNTFLGVDISIKIDIDFSGSLNADGSIGKGSNKASGSLNLDASNSALSSALKGQLQTESFAAQFNADGTLTEDAITSSAMIVAAQGLNNADIPSGFSKWATPAMEMPDGQKWQVHFYRDDKSGAVWYGLDYKSTTGKRP